MTTVEPDARATGANSGREDLLRVESTTRTPLRQSMLDADPVLARTGRSPGCRAVRRPAPRVPRDRRSRRSSATDEPRPMSSAQPAGPQERLDGRTARARRTRNAVVDALLALQEEGDLSPTAQRVAERAGVALRTVYGQFSDMETLWATAGRRELARLAGLVEPVPADLPLAERIDVFCRSRARVLEALLPVMRAARLREPFSPQLLRNRALFIAAGDEEVRRAFAPELAALACDARASLLDRLYLVTSGPSWEALRDDRGLSVEAATDAVHRSVVALLAPDVRT